MVEVKTNRSWHKTHPDICGDSRLHSSLLDTSTIDEDDPKHERWQRQQIAALHPDKG
jgi:hypothetical protein